MSCRNYTNPYLHVNPSTIKGTMQVSFLRLITFPASIDVLIAVFTSKCLYPVSIRYSRHLVLSKKLLYLEEKDGGMQTLVQFPDLIAAAVAKEALEGHYIYDGGYCKLYLSYSRHIDLNVKA
ncbi:hypothetical protein GIB67_032308 [Kingdonia uniflora]|uniref:Uncharacterized protein n=1 Tax=Kingdonia uniflora TaxID=39325 RepID=A0A7J7MXI7_9MAGN|nr:hypothetical protein GIB67_032308 [Kingdonia uniflora]